MRKPWTLRLTRTDGGKPGPLAYAVDSDLPRFWTRYGASRYCMQVNAHLLRTRTRWVPTRTRRKPW